MTALLTACFGGRARKNRVAPLIVPTPTPTPPSSPKPGGDVEKPVKPPSSPLSRSSSPNYEAYIYVTEVINETMDAAIFSMEVNKFVSDVINRAVESIEESEIVLELTRRYLNLFADSDDDALSDDEVQYISVDDVGSESSDDEEEKESKEVTEEIEVRKAASMP